MVEPSALPRPVKLAHVVLRTRDNFEAMFSWYRTVLNAEVVFDAPGVAFLTYDDEHHRIAIAAVPTLAPALPGDAPRQGMDHVAFTYDDIGDLLDIYAHLKQQGIEPFGSVNHGPTTSLYYRDPDGNRIELQVDNFADMDDATRLMRETFAINPVGIDFDPEAAYRALKNGADKADLIRPPATEDLQPVSPDLLARLSS
nr:VOC family protein [Sphingomonas sp. CDS-1]